MPECGVTKLPHENILSVDEIEEIAKSAASLGIKKIRITGGEPLVRRGIEEIVTRIANIPGVDEVALTTNAVLLPEKIDALKATGVQRVNVSLDTLDPEMYKEITRGGDLQSALLGIRAAIDAGMTPLKINAVLIGGVNDDQIVPLAELTKDEDIDVRFIEIMPIGECASWNGERFIGANRVLESIPGLEPAGLDGVAKIYRREGYKGTVGIINPISNHFCGNCNRVRVTADGKLKPCLHSSDEIPLKGLHGDELTEAIRAGIFGKPISHKLENGAASCSSRGMSAIGG
jgi:cyclic pyranopterin phosphate synthase